MFSTSKEALDVVLLQIFFSLAVSCIVLKQKGMNLLVLAHTLPTLNFFDINPTNTYIQVDASSFCLREYLGTTCCTC